MRDPGVFPPTVAPTGYRSAWLLSWPWIFPQGPAYRYRLARHPIDADRGRRERPPLRFGAPSALPPWRVHFPEPVPGPSVRSVVPRAVDLSPGGDSRRRGLSVGLGPGHCPTTDESVAVMVGASIRERPRERGRSARCGPSDDRGRTPGWTGVAGHQVSELPPGPRSREEDRHGPRRRPPGGGRPRGPQAACVDPPRPVGPGPSGGSVGPPPGGCVRSGPPSSLCRGRTVGDRPSVVRRPPCRHPGPKPEVVVEGPETAPDLLRGAGRGARPDGAWFLVASFHTRFVPPSPFSTTLAACPSPGPSGVFHPVTLMGFGFRSE